MPILRTISDVVRLYPKNFIFSGRLLAFLVFMPGMLMQAQKPDREYQLKAVFLFNFTQFIEWPAKAFSEPETPLVIGVLGKNPFGDYLKQTVSDEKVNKHPLHIQYFNSVEEVRNCHILFINIPETERLGQTLSVLKGKNILTVGDAGSFLKQGGMIRFFTRDDRIQLQINPDAIKAEDLAVSSQLLRLAEIVVPKKSN